MHFYESFINGEAALSVLIYDMIYGYGLNPLVFCWCHLFKPSLYVCTLLHNTYEGLCPLC